MVLRIKHFYRAPTLSDWRSNGVHWGCPHKQRLLKITNHMIIIIFNYYTWLLVVKTCTYNIINHNVSESNRLTYFGVGGHQRIRIIRLGNVKLLSEFLRPRLVFGRHCCDQVFCPRQRTHSNGKIVRNIAGAYYSPSGRHLWTVMMCTWNGCVCRVRPTITVKYFKRWRLGSTSKMPRVEHKSRADNLFV